MMIKPFRCTNNSNNPKGGTLLRKIMAIGENQDKRGQQCHLLHKPLPRQEEHKPTKFAVPLDAKRVRFSKQVLCRSVKRYDEPDKIWLTRKEMEEIWNGCWMTIESMMRRLQEISGEKQQSADYDVIRDYYDKYDDELEMMENLTPIGDEELCTRGFEQKTPKGAILRAHNKRMSNTIVMTEQRRCRELDAECLAQLYHSATEASSRAARTRGLNDEREAMAILGL